MRWSGVTPMTVLFPGRKSMPMSLSTPVTSIVFVTAGLSVSNMTSVLSPVSPRTGAETAMLADAAKAAEAIRVERMIFMVFLPCVEPFGRRPAVGFRRFHNSRHWAGCIWMQTAKKYLRDASICRHDGYYAQADHAGDQTLKGFKCRWAPCRMIYTRRSRPAQKGTKTHCVRFSIARQAG
ncbi:hypothetical protein D3C87_1587130 [compost metagenome]